MEIKGSKVQLQPLGAKPAISGQFQTNTFNLKNVLKTLGITPPSTKNPAALSQLQANFALKADTESANFTGLNVKLDKSTLTGKLGIKNYTSPSLQPQLTINSINLDDYLSGSGNKSATASQSTSQTKTSTNQELLPLETLRKVNIDGNFKIGKMVVNKLTLSNIIAKVKAKQGLIVIDPANAQLYKGNYKGRITVDARQGYTHNEHASRAAGIRSEGLLFDLFQDKYISGGTKLVTELTSRGNSIDALLKNLNGKTHIAFNDGTIRDSNFAEKVSLAVKVFEKKEHEGGKSVVKFTGLSGDWKTTNGVFSTNNLKLLSPYFQISGSGTANVANQKLDMKLRIGPKASKGDKKLFAPLRIHGTFSNPKFSLDLKDLIKTVAAQDLEKIKLKAEKKKRALQQKLAGEKKALQQKLVKEKELQKQKLKQKADAAKANAIKKLKEKTGKQLGDKLLNKLGGDKTNATQEPAIDKPSN
ncbi:Protein AsmA [Nymphon striatum]|nr:Protein AsmA [Nymphon striatum]